MPLHFFTAAASVATSYSLKW